MANVKLTEDFVRALEPPTDVAQAYYWDDEDTGFGLVIGRSGKPTFIVRGRTNGKRIKVTIGQHRDVRADGHSWSVALARKRARELLGLMAGGTNPSPTAAPAEVAAAGPTLRDGLKAHVARMRKKQRSERSIATVEAEVSKYMADWLDRPFSVLTGAAMVEIHDSIKRRVKPRVGTNPNNDKGAPLANRVVAHVSACWNSLNKKLEGALGTWNPAKAVDKDVLKPKRERIPEGAMPGWAKRVETMRNPIQRDGLMLALYTGLRSEDVRTIRWEQVDFEARTLRLPDPKGGVNAAFTIPLSPTPYAILKRRQADNKTAPLFATSGDHGWAFPSMDVKGVVMAIGDLRQQVHGDTHSRFPVEDVHTLRRTWESIAHEEGISELDQHVLSNHSFASHNVNATYIAQHLTHLAECAAKIDAGIARRLDPPKLATPKPSRAKPRNHLRAIP